MLRSRKRSTSLASVRVWRTFENWCQEQGYVPLRASVVEVLDFLQDGLERGLSLSSLKVQVSALSCFRGKVTTTGCRLELQKMTSFSMDGDFVLGVIFPAYTSVIYPFPDFREILKPAHCEGFQTRLYHDILAILFAIEEVNQNQYLLQNHTLGFRILDSCFSEVVALQDTLLLLTGGNRTIPNYKCEAHLALTGIIGELFSSVSEVMARILGVYRIPQISIQAQHPMLSDKIQFPSVLRTYPSDTLQPQAIAQLLRHFNWTWVGILASNYDTASLSSQKIRQNVEENGGCVAFLEKINDRYRTERLMRVAEVIHQSSVNIIICICYEIHFKPVLEILPVANIRPLIWIFSTQWTFKPYLFSKESWRLFNGSLVFIGFTSNIPHFTDFLYSMLPSNYQQDTFSKLFWEKAFICHWEGQNMTHMVTGKDSIPCTGEEDLKTLDPKLFQLNDLSISYHAYLAVYAYAHTLHNMIVGNAKEDDFGIDSSIHDIKPWQVLHYLWNVRFTTESGEDVYFDVNGDVPTVFDIMNINIHPDDTSELTKVGRYDSRRSPGEEIILNITAIRWNQMYNQTPHSVCSESCPVGYRNSARLGQPSCCFDCAPCSIGEIANETDTAECWKCPEDQWPNENRDKCIPKIIEFLSYQEPLGAALAAIAVTLSLVTLLILSIFYMFQDTPIVRANNRGLSYLLLCTLALCFLCCLIFIGHPTKLTCMMRQPTFGLIFTISVSCILAKTVTVIIAFKAVNPHSPLQKWVGPKTPNLFVMLGSFIQLLICIYWISSHPPYPKNNTNSESGKLIIECNDELTILFYSMLGYLGFLAIIGFIVAFLARMLPDSFNEAKFITFSMLVFVSVWLSFIPAHLSTQGKNMVAVEIFAILSSGAGLLFLIFLPKCYIILLQPEMNTKELLGRKMTTSK
ncbi:vomeronasal type-2 receptor 26-like [Microcaecilia unicolor]|uniref:Vomeronasal type-2 receptor 26-like n=1 Tax=Microcaecilia unicolor TaxID=1415580 RepID=A0A6P7XJH7_9AMPH|nr:vomeronasal type-2 receptor 26-like [Microcaecilia unicolor]